MPHPLDPLSTPSSPWEELPSQLSDPPSDTSPIIVPSDSASPSPLPRVEFDYPPLRIPLFRRVTGPFIPRVQTSDGIGESQSRSTSLRSLMQEGKRVLMGRKKSKSVSVLVGPRFDQEVSQISFDLSLFPDPPSPLPRPLYPESLPSPLSLPIARQPRQLSTPFDMGNVPDTDLSSPLPEMLYSSSTPSLLNPPSSRQPQEFVPFDLARLPDMPSSVSRPLHAPTTQSFLNLSSPRQSQHTSIYLDSSPFSTSSLASSLPITSTPLSAFDLNTSYPSYRSPLIFPRQPNHTPLSDKSPLSNISRNKVRYALTPSPEVDFRDTSTSSLSNTHSLATSRVTSSLSSLNPITPFMTRPSSVVVMEKGEVSPTEIDSDEEREDEGVWMRRRRSEVQGESKSYEEDGDGREEADISFEPPEDVWNESRQESEEGWDVDEGESFRARRSPGDRPDVRDLDCEDLHLGSEAVGMGEASSRNKKQIKSPVRWSGLGWNALEGGHEPKTPPKKMIPTKFGSPPPEGIDFDRSPFKELYKRMGEEV